MAVAEAADGFRLWYEAAGQGPALIFPVRKRAEYDSLITALAGQYRVVRYKPRQMTTMEPGDEVGGPWSPRDWTAYPTDLEVSDLHTVADAAGIDQFVLAGYSGTGALAAFITPSTDRAAGLAVGGFPLLTPYDYWLGCVEGTRMVSQGAGMQVQADLAYMSVLLYREWVNRDDAAALTALRGPKILWFGSRDSEPGCAMHDMLGGGAIARRINGNIRHLHSVGFEIIELEGYDHLAAVSAVDVLVPRLTAALAVAGWK